MSDGIEARSEAVEGVPPTDEGRVACSTSSPSGGERSVAVPGGERSVAVAEAKERVGVPGGEERVEIPASALPLGEAGRVLIAPWGRVRSANGEFVVDEEAAALVLEGFQSHGTDLPIDYEHQSLGGTYASPSGQAPAAGWIRGLRVVRPDDGGDDSPGLYGDVEWTAAARARLAAKEYRYLSPVVIIRKQDRRVVALHSAALTNKPAIVGMTPIVNRQEANGGGQPHDASHPFDEAVEALRLRLGLEAGSNAQTVVAAAAQRLGELTLEAAEREAGERVAAAMRAGKLAPVQREWATALAMKDPEAFDAWAESAPVVVSLGRIEAPSANGMVKGRERAVVIASARAAYRAEPALAMLTDEAAWIGEALREAGLESE